jgi:hypothetical protein
MVSTSTGTRPEDIGRLNMGIWPLGIKRGRDRRSEARVRKRRSRRLDSSDQPS